MKFDDILALAKQGYKPSDIKELLSLDTAGSKEQAEEKPEEQPVTQAQSTVEDLPEENKPKPEEPTLDYKTMYEELKEKENKLSEQLRQSQEANRRKDISGKTENVTVDSILDDLLK